MFFSITGDSDATTNHKHVLTLAVCVSGAALFVLAAPAQADSQRIQWNNNGHFYQRFDQAVTWAIAKNKCETQGANLATITSVAENSFVYNSLNSNLTSSWYFIGASDAQKEGAYAWVTGEKWSYQNWSAGADFGDSYDYAAIRLTSNYNDSSLWDSASANYIAGYICEWSRDNYVGMTVVPDLNNNGSDEIAALYVDYVTAKHTVKIKDPKTDALLSTLIFKTGLIPPQGVVAINDLNGNGIPEIGVLYTEFGQAAVGIKDAKSNATLLNTLRFLGTAYWPSQITASPDSNGNGASEITVLGTGKTSDKKPKAETRDSQTGQLLGDTTF